VGGAFIVTDDPQPRGTELTVTLVLGPDGGELAVAASVRWVAEGGEDDDRGMGVRFQGLTAEQARALDRHLAALPAVVDHDDLA
jgi:hypothetical protein